MLGNRNNPHRVYLQTEHGRSTIYLARYSNNLSERLEQKPVPHLWFNPAANQLEGTDPDAFRTPVPGEPRKNRAAMAVLIEAALTCLTEEDRKD